MVECICCLIEGVIMDINVIELAYLGDAYYELMVRSYLLKSGIRKVDNLQKLSISYVSATSQADILKNILDKLTTDELDIVKRARNYKRKTHPKNTDILTYKHSTAFEALIGYLYINNNIDRINELLVSIWRN